MDKEKNHPIKNSDPKMYCPFCGSEALGQLLTSKFAQLLSWEYECPKCFKAFNLHECVRKEDESEWLKKYRKKSRDRYSDPDFKPGGRYDRFFPSPIKLDHKKKRKNKK